MNQKVRCQSCGMPLSDEFDNYGTHADGSKHPEYCMFCFEDGAFTNPDQTLEEMIASSVENMMQDLGFPEEKARQLAHDVIPKLKRWQKPPH
ncbi:MAG TPA: zinc ribbon domain-containing protein [Candidatus Acidoferrales bacterium]|nr:zinc ribbon domain-containing protein [Candidatus Acidoferrales bacterium]